MTRYGLTRSQSLMSGFPVGDPDARGCAQSGIAEARSYIRT